MKPVKSMYDRFNKYYLLEQKGLTLAGYSTMNKGFNLTILNKILN